MAIFMAINGYLTLIGLVVEGIRHLAEAFGSPEVGKPIVNVGTGMIITGATRKGVKKAKGMPVF